MRALAASFLLFAGTAAAHAADLPPQPMPYKAPVMVSTPVVNWTGCYVGGHAGYAWSRSNYTLDNGTGLVESFSDNPSNFMGGGQVGCQYQFSGNWVVGIEGTWSWDKLQQTDISVINPVHQRTLGINQIATATGRLGYAWDRWMLYAKGGFADAKIDTYAINTANGVFGDANAWQTGWTVGGGLEYMVMPSLVIGAEFNYYRFGFDRSLAASNGTVGSVYDSRAEVYSALVRASWLFNWGGPVVARY